MAAETGIGILQTVALLGTAVIAVPLFRKLGLGSVLGYLAAGLIIGPNVLRVVTDADTLLHVAELGVVLFLFVIGLEMRPSKLWKLRGDIFGLGTAQVLTCTALLTGVAYAAGLPLAAAAVGAAGFVLSSTAVIMKMLDESGELGETAGQRAVSILLLEDLAIVPLLAAVALWAATNGQADPNAPPAWQSIAIAAVTIAGVIAAGKWLLDPFFALLARVGAREVMTAAALLVVLGAALVMQAGGLSMAMGAFLAGVLLSESTFRHQLEADIEPFRGLLLGLFFLSVGMSLDLAVVISEWRVVIAGVAAFMLVKALRHLRGRAAIRLAASRKHAARRDVRAGRRVRVRAVRRRACRRHVGCALERHLLGGRDPFDGADAGRGHLGTALRPARTAIDGRYRCRCRLERQRARHRLRPFRADRVPGASRRAGSTSRSSITTST